MLARGFLQNLKTSPRLSSPPSHFWRLCSSGRLRQLPWHRLTWTSVCKIKAVREECWRKAKTALALAYCLRMRDMRYVVGLTSQERTLLAFTLARCTKGLGRDPCHGLSEACFVELNISLQCLCGSTSAPGKLSSRTRITWSSSSPPTSTTRPVPLNDLLCGHLFRVACCSLS